MPVLQIRELIAKERISECILEEITDVLVPINEPVTVTPKEFDGRKLESTTKDGSDLGGEDEENKLEELKVVIVIGGDAEYIKKL